MHDQTQTTGIRRYQGRVCPTTTTIRKDLRRYVGATSLCLGHAPTRETKERGKQNTSMQPCWKDAGQRACTVPAERYQAVICREPISTFCRSILTQEQESGNPSTLAPRAFSFTRFALKAGKVTFAEHLWNIRRNISFVLQRFSRRENPLKRVLLHLMLLILGEHPSYEFEKHLHQA